ncbi:hypothetical protein NPIL_36161 [Nephila pilipes]|uniref:Uncharacterized protein n=1 Tax=Nephila pilipes TaxID=299642 RepID=A0A8X6MWB4_NEPPI|nr:hypothetical protein NPIL_36161 [Nephila pilipes]
MGYHPCRASHLPFITGSCVKNRFVNEILIERKFGHGWRQIFKLALDEIDSIKRDCREEALFGEVMVYIQIRDAPLELNYRIISRRGSWHV